jgi:hypothetical protein
MAKVTHLCATCVYAFGHPLDSDSPGEHHSTTEAIQQAVQEGCFICSEVWKVNEQGLVIRRDNNKAVDHERHLPAKYAIDYFGGRGQFIGFCILDGPGRTSGLDLMTKKGLYPEFGTSL